jgi:hypothetical protein
VIVAPPSSVDAVQEIVDCVDSNEVALATVGAFGTVDGTAVFEIADTVLVPALFVAVTVNVYDPPLINPLIVHVVVVLVQLPPPEDAVTVYSVIGAPPFEAGAAHVITDSAFAFEDAITLVATPGAVAGVADAEAIDAADVPETFVAVTLNV